MAKHSTHLRVALRLLMVDTFRIKGPRVDRIFIFLEQIVEAELKELGVVAEPVLRFNLEEKKENIVPGPFLRLNPEKRSKQGS